MPRTPKPWVKIETYKEIVRRLDKAHIPIQGLPLIEPYRYRVTVRLDPTRTPRIGKLRRWMRKARLTFCVCYPYRSEGKGGHYAYKIEVDLLKQRSSFYMHDNN